MKQPEETGVTLILILYSSIQACELRVLRLQPDSYMLPVTLQLAFFKSKFPIIFTLPLIPLLLSCLICF